MLGVSSPAEAGSRLQLEQQTLECPALAELRVCLKSYDL